MPMTNLWRRSRNKKGNGKSSSDENATQNRLVLLGNPVKRFDWEDVLRASKRILGKGTFGTTYKVDLEDGTTSVVVKKLEDVVLSAEDFRDKVVALGAMDQENLLPPRGYFYSKDVKFLLYDYMPLGSLSSLQENMNCAGSLSIALGAARAIEHLHAQGCHGNVKSSNILLTPSYKARVSDYGLTLLTRSGQAGLADPIADVHSFGMSLLELLTNGQPTSIFRNELGHVASLPTWVQSVILEKGPGAVLGSGLLHHSGDIELLKVAISCVSPNSRPRMSEVRRRIEELCNPGEQRDDGDSQPDKFSEGTRNTSWPIPSAKKHRDSQPNQSGKVHNDFHPRKPPEGVLEVSERIYIIDCCLTADGLKYEDHQFFVGGVVDKMQQHFPGAFFKVFDFMEQGSQSQISELLSHMPVMNYSVHHGHCPILTREMIHHFLRSAIGWLSLDEHKNMLLMHCESGGWTVLAFMLAALLLYRTKSHKKEETLHLIYKKVPRDLHLISPLNPLPSHLRYLRYISKWNVDSERCQPDRVLTLDRVILGSIPWPDAIVEYPYRATRALMFKICGQDPRNLTDKTPTVLFSTPERGKHIRHCKQADCKRVTVDIHCPVQGDVVLECMSLRAGREHGETLFRVMFNTAYLLKNVLMLRLDQMDVPWDRQNQYSTDFRAEITFSEVNPAASPVSVDSFGDEEQKEKQLAEGAKKIEAQELQVEDQAVYSGLLSRDANTSHEENEVREYLIQSDAAFPTSILLPTLSSQLEAIDRFLASSDSASSSLSQDGSPVSFSAMLTKKNIEPLQSPKQQLVSSLELSPDVHSVSIDSPGDEEQTEIEIAKRDKKIEAQELQIEDQAVCSAPLSQDANTSHEENEVREWPIQSNTAFPISILLPTLPSQLEASVHSALDGSLATSNSASSSLSQDGSSVSFSAMLTKNNIEPLQSPKQHLVSSLELSQDVHSGENTESVRWEGLAASTETNMEVTSVSDSASSSVVNNGSVEATAVGVSNSAQFPDMMLLKQEKLYQQDGSPSSTSMSSGYDYDVFLNFRGPNTRLGITDVLYTRLLGARIHTFKDDEELRVGEEFGPELLKAISQSKIAIPIFSKGYASSKWCLNELVQMVEGSKTRRQKVMPIFYDVTPAEVRHQIGSYEEAFLSHKEKFGSYVHKWKAALNHVANLNGWDNSKKNRGEGELVDEIVQKVIDELKTAYLLVTDCLVGVENHVKEIDAMMCGDSEDIRILGIHGMGGVGKTTLAKIIYNRLSHHFEACCFLSNIKETSELKGIEGLQNQLISDVLDKKWSNISNVQEGIKIIKERLCGKKVLVLFDDVDQMTHWDALIGKPAWFGLGSKIIITSRNRDIVDVPEVCCPYELMSMDFNQSLQLFCKHAFERDCPSDDYVAFSTEVVKSTGGLPLALEAIGKLLTRRNKDVWDVILKKLKQAPLNEVKRRLKISYDALDDWQKRIFLDIACRFTGFDQKIVLHTWKDSNLFPEEGLEVLQKMSLIKIDEKDKLWMHNQLRGLGRDIVRQERDKERKKKTRLWNHAVGLDVVMEPKGTKKCEALCRKLDPQLLYNFANEEVERLSNLKYHEVRVFQDNWPPNDRVYGNSTCLILSKIGICVCLLGRQFFWPSLQ